jgi:tight adherence protein B
MALLIASATFLIVAAILMAVWSFFGSSTNQEMVRDRMEAVRKAERGGDVAADLQLLRDEMLSTVPLLNRLMNRLSWSNRLQKLIMQSGVVIKPGKVLLYCAVSAVAAYLVLDRLTGEFLIGVVSALAGAAIPIVVVAIIRARRLRQFEQRFPEALDLLGRAVRAGHAFTTGLEMVSKESPEPVATEFRTAFEEQNFGLPLRDALLNMTERIPLFDVRFFVTALMIQKETGGNLAEILDELARLIRERFRIHREVGIKTAQGRLTATILIALPVGMLFLMKIMNPSYMQVLFDDPIGPKILAGAAVMQVIGAGIIWKIVNIEI